MVKVTSLRFSPDALRDLNAVADWLTQRGSGRRAHDQLVQIRRAIAELRRHPDRWPIEEHQNVRGRQVGRYRIVYEIASTNAGRSVIVLRVFGPGQDRRQF